MDGLDEGTVVLLVSLWTSKVHLADREDKESWASIVKAYKGHYGVHMDPKTAYLRFSQAAVPGFQISKRPSRSHEGLPADGSRSAFKQ